MKQQQNTFSSSTRSVAWALLLVFVTTLIPPPQVFAGGPTQPEVQGFTPIGVSDMVDPFTGDFTYNIPLMDVEGYPINISYNSGVTMDQEASWVGLGWNLNMGAIVRNMRGLPDDFNGDVVEKKINQKPTVNIGLDLGANFEVFGFNPNGIVDGDVNFNVGVGVGYNNYNGYNTEFSFGPSFKFNRSNGLHGTAGFNLSGSSENGASFSPSISFDSKFTNFDKLRDRELTSTIGSSVNSRAGLQYISYSATSKMQYYKVHKNENGDNVYTAKYSSGARPKGSAGGSYNIGLHNYSPTSGPSMWGFAVSGNMNIGGSLFGADASFKIGVSYSRQWIPDDWKTQTNKAYGYLFLQEGQNNEKALLDFNRDNEGSFSKYSLNLPSAALTYDLFSVQAQGTGGSFRGFRTDVGYVFDPAAKSSNVAASLGFEFGLGGLFDAGADFSGSYTSSSSGVWSNRNEAIKEVGFENDATNFIGEYAFLEAAERSVDVDNLVSSQFFGNQTAYYPLQFGLPGLTKLKQEVEQNESNHIDLNAHKRSNRIKTNNQMYFLSHKEMSEGLGVRPLPTGYYSGAQDHHIAEITQLGMDGRRYVFGLPAYNHFQSDVTFAIGKTVNGTPGQSTTDHFRGLIGYSSTDASLDNERGLDNFYSSQRTPAYAHSYMLTSVLSDDYSDADNVPGPSINDLGSYVKFDYTKVEDNKWRTPIQEDEAYYNEGLKTDFTDDKASYVYGEKDLWYVKAVETKNYVAVFELEDRKDGHSAIDENGGVSSSTANSMKCLKKITLYARKDYYDNISDLSNATPIQEVTFCYDYSRCQDYPANINYPGADDGKLTLKEIKFTYQGSNKMKPRSYKFTYSTVNPSYNMKAVDRWGVYKPNGSGLDTPLNPTITNADWPYADQNAITANSNASAWHLTEIKLPSGGKIKVEYESDDYQFVQHQRASQMFKIVAVEQEGVVDAATLDGTPEFQSVSEFVPLGEENRAIYFELKDPSDAVEDYAYEGQMIYIRALMDFRPGLGDNERGKADYVPVWAKISNLSKVVVSGHTLGRIELVPEQLTDAGLDIYNPITKAAILFGRTQMPRDIYDLVATGDVEGSEQGIVDFANSVVSSLASFGELLVGPNTPVYLSGKGRKMVVNKSFIRLYEPSGTKLGGGSRVKKILMSDNWGDMNGSGNPSETYEYGQEFSYKLPDGTSSGVAAYEPQLGGDENTWHQPYVVNNVKRFAPDDKMYMEDPIMESQFPSPTVGYSMVTIKDLPRENVTRTATGKVVKEFYTAKDFPTIVHNSDADVRPANSFLPLLPKYQYLTATQGFVIELNDMHGKPKRDQVFSENVEDGPISKVEYIYQSDATTIDGISAGKLNSTVQVIRPDGTTGTAEIGVKYDVVSDFRESESKTIGGTIQINTNSLLLGFLPIVVPTIYPKVDISENRFRSATLNKVINRFGILKTTRADQDGSKVETNNLAYDSETGDVLVTQTATNFEDKVYSLNYPGYWEYPQLGSAYKNINFTYTVSSFSGSGFATIPASENLFSEGDELSVEPIQYLSSFAPLKAWVIERSSNGIRLIDKEGNPVNVSNAKLKVVRSGYRNKQGTSMASMTSLSNPLGGISNNKFTKVLNAGAVKFGNNWKTYCDCFNEGDYRSTNPYVIGTKGNWRPVASYTHLTGRVQSDFDNNTNTRRDGVFSSYSPFYQVRLGDWSIVPENWTFVSEVTEFSPNGMTMETRDALGRYSASLYSFNNTLTSAIGANAQLKELAVGDFEDGAGNNCTDNRFFKIDDESIIVETQAHTGKNAIKVTEDGSVVFSNILPDCEVLENQGCNGTPTVTYHDGAGWFFGLIGTSGIQDVSYEQVVGDCGLAYGSNGGFEGYILEGASSSYTEMNVTVTSTDGCWFVVNIIWDPSYTNPNPLVPSWNHYKYEIIDSGQN